MRINMDTPFAEKDAVKALGAKWDPARKVWYIVNAEDLTPFLRWIPGVQDVANQKPTPKQNVKGTDSTLTSTGPAVLALMCACDVLPWDDSQHTALG